MSTMALVFKTALGGDVTAPVLSAVSSGTPGTATATLTWTTNEAADSQVQYGLTTAYGSSVTEDTSPKVTSHSVDLTSLSSNTTYYYRVRSADAAGNVSDWTTSSFLTAVIVDVTAPVISAVSSGTPGVSSVTITWSTDELSDSQVEYGSTASYGNSTTLDATRVTSHSVGISSLVSGSLYHYRVKSRDAAGNLATGTDNTFNTAGAQSIAVILAAIRDLQPGEWYEIGNTALNTAKYSWPGSLVPTKNAAQPFNMSYSGGTFDSVYNRMLVFGGGHLIYGGNEVYALSFDDFVWSYLNEPSPYAIAEAHTQTDAYYSDGRPVSRHSYNQLAFMWPWASLVAVGANAVYFNSDQNVDLPLDVLWDYKRTANPHLYASPTPWTTRGDYAVPVNAYSCSCVDPVTGHLWLMNNQISAGGIFDLDPSTGTWTTRWANNQSGGSFYGYYSICAIDPINRYLIKIGYGKYEKWSIDTDPIVKVASVSGSSIAPLASTHPTLAWNSRTGRFCSWIGGTDRRVVYELDAANGVDSWTTLDAAP
ncbi:MAG: hypothetical protein EHM35_14175, partial [Planctomycetaceae bacterium]